MRARELFETGVGEDEGVEEDIVDTWEDCEDKEVINLEADKVGEIVESEGIGESTDVGAVEAMVGVCEPTVADGDKDKDELTARGNGKVDVAADRGELKDPVIPLRVKNDENAVSGTVPSTVKVVDVNPM